MAPLPRPPVPGGPYLVAGLARSGVAAALALRAAAPGADIVACDSREPREAAEAAGRLRAAGVEVHLNTDGTQLLAAESRPQALVKSPGVPARAPLVARARELGLDVLGELELGWRLLPNEFCAVTGTNGKTTTTELIGAIHRAAGLPVEVAGNVGTPVSALAGTADPAALIACETSSFQLEDTTAFAPETAVFLNFSEDHLDRHATLDEYLAAKLRVFAHQPASAVAVLNAAEPELPNASLGQGRQVWFGDDPWCELRLKGAHIEWRGKPVMEVSEVGIAGPHNLENAMAAAAATLARGVDPEAVREGLREFGGVPHRLERVAEVAGVTYVNDSKATNVSAAAAALRSFEGVHAILGGSLKGGSFEPLAATVRDHCRACYLIGEAQERLAEDLAAAGVPLHRCDDLERAVSGAASNAEAGEVVLLAPACASFDQYEDYVARGEHFRDLVAALERA
jgi:UDP-N-acetylmuramoylalanine--D-glutamate ligase